jgi:hypothetical protein
VGGKLSTIVNSAKENRAEFCKLSDGKPLFSALYGMYTVALKELQAILKVNAQAGQNAACQICQACGHDDIANECLRHLPRRPLVHLTNLFNHCLPLSHFPKPWKEAKVTTLPKPGKDPKFPQNLRPITLSTSKQAI